MSSLPIVAIVGRPNVGKSTLFNRFIGVRYAITSPVSGTTRDRIYHEATLGTRRVILADMGGIEFGRKRDIEADIQSQAKIAIAEADLIFFVIDATEPLTASDFDCAHFLRKSKKPVILIAHKTDNKKSELHMPEIHELGLGEALPLSSIHNIGIAELEKAAQKSLRKIPRESSTTGRKSAPIKLAMVGKPNTGKSSLVNALLGEKRLIVSEIPGTTIDATDTPFIFDKNPFVLIDTAGLRRRGRIGKGIERLGVLRALRAVSRCDVTCLVLDGSEKLSQQDLHIVQYILDAGKGLIVVVNKSDLFEDLEKDREKMLQSLSYRMDFIPWAPVIFVSALTKKNIFKILELAKNIAAERKKKVPTAEFPLFIKTTVLAHPPQRSGKKITITKAVQTETEPPTFAFSCNKPDLVHFSYRRYLENEIRRKYGFYGTVIRLEFMKER